jgi:hypothetical protein
VVRILCQKYDLLFTFQQEFDVMKILGFLMGAVVMGSLFSCRSVDYYHYNPANDSNEAYGMYTELCLHKNGEFEEYLYWSVQDSVDQTNDGVLIKGTFEKSGDTLKLWYSFEGDVAENSRYEFFLMKGNGLYLIEPVRYSYQFLGKVLSPGKSETLRGLPNYTTVEWKDGF